VEAVPSCKNMTPIRGAVHDCPSSPDHFTGILDHLQRNPGPLALERNFAPRNRGRNEMMLMGIYRATS
jgi:hypothetical protein